MSSSAPLHLVFVLYSGSVPQAGVGLRRVQLADVGKAFGGCLESLDSHFAELCTKSVRINITITTLLINAMRERARTMRTGDFKWNSLGGYERLTNSC